MFHYYFISLEILEESKKVLKKNAREHVKDEIHKETEKEENYQNTSKDNKKSKALTKKDNHEDDQEDQENNDDDDNSKNEEMIKKEAAQKKNKDKLKEHNANLQTASSRSYLEQTVVAIVTQGMAELAKERPENPLEFLANYLMKHANK